MINGEATEVKTSSISALEISPFWQETLSAKAFAATKTCYQLAIVICLSLFVSSH
jgi:hypothetical protein